MSTIHVSLRPAKGNTLFSFYIRGKGIDHARVASNPREAVDVVRTVTERTDLVFGDLEWFSEFRPNVRMVDKFGEGRVLLVGGSLSLNSHLAKKVLNNDFQMLRTHIPPLVPKVQRFLMIGLIRY
jgi:hypothetical protein